VRYVFRHLPRDEAHPNARFAAEASEAAAEQDLFWEMHDQLFAHADRLGEDDIYGYAAELGVDLERFEETLRTGATRLRVVDDAVDAEVGEITQTPTFYLGVSGEDLLRHTGPFDAATLIRRLEEARRRGESGVGAG